MKCPQCKQTCEVECCTIQRNTPQGTITITDVPRHRCDACGKTHFSPMVQANLEVYITSPDIPRQYDKPINYRKVKWMFPIDGTAAFA